MIPILDWIFEGIVNWIASIASTILDAVSGLFLEALGTDMTAMEEYFPFITKAYGTLQYTSWAILYLIVMWQIFRAFGGPITEAENPWHLVIRGAIYGLLIGYAKNIAMFCLEIARIPYTSLLDISMTGEDFTFAGVEEVLTNGLTTIVAASTVAGLILVLILLIALGWNYFKLVTFAGSSSTGTIRPFGLDCSGFTDWVYKTALGVSIQAGSWGQYTNSTPISESELLPGDLGFLMNDQGTTSHVLIFVGYTESGARQWVHSESGAGVHVSTPRYDAELVLRRPNNVDFSQDVGSSAYGEPLYSL